MRSQIPLCTGIQTSIKALYTQFHAIYTYADTSKSSDIAIYHAIKVIKVPVTTSLLIKDRGINWSL
jgi:hypothetical protein